MITKHNKEEEIIKNEEIVKEAEDKNYNCKKCNKEYKTTKYLINHEEKCNGLNILTCSKCMITFT